MRALRRAVVQAHARIQIHASNSARGRNLAPAQFGWLRIRLLVNVRGIRKRAGECGCLLKRRG